MFRLEHQALTDPDRGVVASDRSADFILKFAQGTPKSLAAVKAASDHFDRSTGLVEDAPPLVPVMDCLTVELTPS